MLKIFKILFLPKKDTYLSPIKRNIYHRNPETTIKDQLKLNETILYEE